MAIGPVQLLVIGFAGSEPVQGQIKRELVNLAGRGMIRFLEGLAIARQRDGTLVELGAGQPREDERAPVEGVIAGLLGLTSSASPAAGAAAGGGPGFAQHEYGLRRSDVAALIEGLAPGTSAALLLVEHLWALKLREAVREVGGHMAASGFLTAEALQTVGVELQAIGEAEAAFDLADAVKGAALIDALEAQARASDNDTSKAPDAAAARNTAAAIETLRVLIVGGLVDEAAAQDALDALVDAGLLDEASLQQAARLAEQQAVATDTALAAVEAVAQRT